MNWMLFFALLLQGVCPDGLSDRAILDCSYVYGGDGGPLRAQLSQPEQVILRSRGSNDARTGFAGSGGDITAAIARPLFDATLQIQTDGGNSSGADTGGDGGNVQLLLDGGRGVESLAITTDGGRALGDGTDGDAGNVAVELNAITLEVVTIQARGAQGGTLTLLLTEGAVIQSLTIDNNGTLAPGDITLDLAEGASIERLQLLTGGQTIQVIGGGAVGVITIGQTTFRFSPG